MKAITPEQVGSGEYIACPLDEKNLTTDWITDELMDGSVGVEHNRDLTTTEALGFIGGVPYYVTYAKHSIAFTPIRGKIYNTVTKLHERLTKCLENTEHLAYTRFYMGKRLNTLVYYFYRESE